MKHNFNEWEELINKIRSWDRVEHDWAVTDKSVEHKNIRTKSSFIKALMKEYDLTKMPTK